MGMYDYLGGEQVKVFSRTCTPLHRKSVDYNDVEYQPYLSGGALCSYVKGDEVPYKTLFYNYGENFIIFDYRSLVPDEEKIVHVIKDGKYFNSYHYTEIPEDIDIVSVIDYYGNPIKVKTIKDFFDIVMASRYYYDLYIDKCNNYEKEFGVFPITFGLDKDKYSHEVLMENLEKMKEARNKASSESLKIFNENWLFDDESYEYKKIYGGFIIGYVLDIIKNNSNLTEWEKHKIVELFIKIINKQDKVLDDLIIDYIEWVGDLISKEEVVSIFDKYMISPSQEVINEYLNSENKKFSDIGY